MDNAEFEWWGVADDMGMVPDPVLHAAQIRSTVLNAQGGKTTPADFLPRVAPAASPKEQMARFRAVTGHLRKD